MAIIDFKGYRIVASSVIPVNKKTIQYGSDNKGKNIHKSSKTLSQLLRSASQKLNIKPHFVLPTKSGSKDPVRLYTSVLSEGHFANDARHYILNVSYSLPPLAPKPNETWKRRCELMRPEFLAKYPKALSPDAFSPFVLKDIGEADNQEIVAATEYLSEVLVSEVSQQLFEAISEKLVNGQSPEGFSLTRFLHAEGLNVKFMGLVAHQMPQKADYMMLLLVEMVARCVKVNLNKLLRERMSQLKSAVDEPFRLLCVSFLNLVFSNTQDSKTYWEETIKPQLSQKFSVTPGLFSIFFNCLPYSTTTKRNLEFIAQ